jgi:hypothetical protein
MAMVSSTDGSSDDDLLEAPLESRILLDVLAVFVEASVAPTQCSSPRAARA